ncbi:helix-turn-helix transcriptional regulator [Jatrophihabitans telluris]|uniref:Helix-turn-helix transcriptional regulator n=1 Tax=Jatrophihabitans telluris TaxID=2038343 RepID=A0ABY4QW82_9ACTN|nr:helix-turn-helix domain-containing protein [Jatrophihabitans telluris]UQX87512.1 helix-turn-helix transcriptional regulator [Jatrophihabitans telluris]
MGFIRGDLFDPDCPTRLILDRVGDKWTVLVVSALSERTLRFSELRARVGGVAPKVLTQTLRALERDGILHRKIYAEVPPRVEYSLTELGRSLIGPIETIQAWAEEYMHRVVINRERFDRAGSGAVGE